ncbi:MAG: hypothetical protein ABIP65_10870 [Vicinamibacterales bacterium]
MRIRSACTAAVLTLTTVCPVLTYAQTVDELVTRHVDARGGYEKLKAVKTLKMTRTVATPFSSVTLIVLKKRPNLIRWEQTPQGQTQAIPRAINATAAWDTVAGGKVVPRAEPMATEGREIDGDFDGLLVDWKEKGHLVAFEGREPSTGGDMFKLKVTTQSGAIRYVYLDAKSGLEVRQTGRVALGPDPKTKAMRYNDVSFTFSDWKVVDGVRFPFAIDEERTGGGITQSFATFTDKIEVNVPVDDAIFAVPSPPAGGGI